LINLVLTLSIYATIDDFTAISMQKDILAYHWFIANEKLGLSVQKRPQANK